MRNKRSTEWRMELGVEEKHEEEPEEHAEQKHDMGLGVEEKHDEEPEEHAEQKVHGMDLGVEEEHEQQHQQPQQNNLKPP